MKIIPLVLFASSALFSFTGCASTPTALEGAIGPDASYKASQSSDGFLSVFTAADAVDSDYHSYFNLHRGYDILDTAGREVQFVQNHDSLQDETPSMVSLKPGTYVISAPSTWAGVVRATITIEAGKTTTVHLDGSGMLPSNRAEIVYLPNGQAVGWRAAGR